MKLTFHGSDFLIINVSEFLEDLLFFVFEFFRLPVDISPTALGKVPRYRKFSKKNLLYVVAYSFLVVVFV